VACAGTERTLGALLTLRLTMKNATFSRAGACCSVAVLCVAGIFIVWSRIAGAHRLAAACPDPIRRTLETSPEFIVYSLHPRPMELEPEELKKNPNFHSYMVLGQTSVTSSQTKTKLLNALYDGISRSDGSAAACFQPRHGIRATTKGRTVDLVICFECQSLEIYDNEIKTTATLTRSPQPVFNEFLTRAGVPLAGK
jgi:hypothetical protein